jgi:hypothetical protein
MKGKVLIVATLLGAQALPSNGQGFVNLNFELANVQRSDPYDYKLEWPLAAPGWSHSSGTDTASIYYTTIHAGISQAFLLVDAAAFPDHVPLEGNFSLAFQSGHDHSSPLDPWVNAYISQTGVVPADAQSLHFLATGNFAVSINGNSLAPYALGNNEYAVDVSAYAGSISELRIVNMNTQPNFSMVMVDAFSFSSTPVPEPSTFLLFALGALGMCLIRRKRVTGRQGRADVTGPRE